MKPRMTYAGGIDRLAFYEAPGFRFEALANGTRAWVIASIEGRRLPDSPLVDRADALAMFTILVREAVA